MTYTVVVKGTQPPDLVRRISQAHAAALQAKQKKMKATPQTPAK